MVEAAYTALSSLPQKQQQQQQQPPMKTRNDNSYLQSSPQSEPEPGQDKSTNNAIATIDVSDLNLTMDDLNKPLPIELLMGIERSGYQSTSRIPSVEDNGCYWVENAKDSDLIFLFCDCDPPLGFFFTMYMIVIFFGSCIMFINISYNMSTMTYFRIWINFTSAYNS